MDNLIYYDTVRLQMQWRDLRDACLFVTGLFLTVHEALFEMTDRPDLLVLYAGMMGLPAYFYSQRNGGNGNGKK